jgi:hypothetical protein
VQDDCKSNAPGIYTLLLAQQSDVLTIPAISAGTVTISTDIVLAGSPAAKWARFQFENGTGGLKIAGKRGGYTADVEIKLLGHGPTEDYAISTLVGRKLVALVEDAEGNIRLLGNKRQACKLEADLDTGKKSGDEAGWTGKLTIEGLPDMPPHYTGAAVVQDDPVYV